MVGRPDVLCHGHFRLLSGLHSDRFVRFSRLADDASALGYIADLLTSVVASWEPDAIVAPSTAGVALGVALGRRLCVPLHLATVDSDGRASALIHDPPSRGARVLVVNDIITTGQGVKRLKSVVEAAGTQTIGCAAFLDRTAGDAHVAVEMPVAVTATAPLPAWSPEDCPLCDGDQPPADARDLN